jgi:NAD(P)-dependent dehydrogenase (short-subunit alcohol dehydrogenase family)
VILIGSGSESQFALAAGKQLAAEGVSVRVVSMPSWELFDRQPVEYRESVSSTDVRARVAVEAALKLGWERYGGLDGAVVGMAGFGASAPANVLYQKFGITTEAVAKEFDLNLHRIAEIWRSGSVLRSWLLDPILAAWQAGKAPLASYEPGSCGPAEADELLARDGRAWLYGCAH